MSGKHFVSLILASLCIEAAAARSMIDCRVVTASITECNPYGSKLLKAKETIQYANKLKLIRVKNLPSPENKSFVNVISVEDMIDRYVNIEDPVRFKKGEPIFIPPEIEPEIEPLIQQISEKPKITYGKYIVVRGDALSKIAKKFGLRSKVLANMNGLTTKSPLLIGQKLKLPFKQKMIDAVSSGNYIIEKGDTLITIAKKFNLDPKALVKFNGLKNYAVIHIGKIIKLPLPHILEEIKTQKRLRVTATAYTSHREQTDKSPFIAAWNNRIRPGMKIIAVSRDMLSKHGMRNGTKVRIGGLPGYYTVRDKMNKRYKRRIDIYMGLDRRRALHWGRRSVIVYW